MKTLLIGFKKYGLHDSNPTEEIIKSLRRDDVVGCVLDPAYAAVRKIPEIIAKERPDYIVTMNLSPFRREPSFEEYAYNEIRSPEPDGEGIVINDGSPIEPEAPHSLNSMLDIPSIQQFLSSRGNSLSMSIDPGAWICNMASYYARLSGIPSVSLHFPLLRDYPLDEDVEIIESIIEYFSMI